VKTFPLALALVSMVAPAAAQGRKAQPEPPLLAPGIISVQEATELTNGWAQLTEGHAAQALARAQQILARDPRNVAALVLAVEAEILRGGALAGLTEYERWLGQRTIEEAGVIRRAARAALAESAAQRADVRARVEALRALAEDGDGEAARLLSAATSGNRVPADARAALGDEHAVQALLADLKNGGPAQVRTVEALGASGSALAGPALVECLKDPRQEVRAAALEALGNLGDADRVPQIAPLLRDSNARVRTMAAGALLRLGDPTGVPVLQQMMADPSVSARLLAAQALASQPDSSWVAQVRELATAEEPEVRAEAARLLGPHDPEFARSVLNALSADDNPAVREMASINMGEVVTSDLSMLRSMLRSTVPLARARAAARVLVITR
jgi:hypothetical protein